KQKGIYKILLILQFILSQNCQGGGVSEVLAKTIAAPIEKVKLKLFIDPNRITTSYTSNQIFRLQLGILDCFKRVFVYEGVLCLQRIGHSHRMLPYISYQLFYNSQVVLIPKKDQAGFNYKQLDSLLVDCHVVVLQEVLDYQLRIILISVEQDQQQISEREQMKENLKDW
ncbi:unnamed protein product, partial (macronuclear) [Paramecium tetraurelia]